jgi:glycerol-3-phosphate dehydrogenase subunit C
MTTIQPVLDETTLSLWSQVQNSADLCVKCNICTSYCPVSNVTRLFPGPKFVGPQAQRFRNPFELSVDDSVDYCSGCGVCTMVCPHGVKVMEMNAKARYKLYQEKKSIPWRNRLLGRSELLGKLGSPFAPVANFFLNNSLARRLIERYLGVHRSAPLPAFSFETFRGWYKGVHQKSSRRLLSDKRVVYFHGCSTNYYEPRVGKAVMAVLEHNGYEVVVPEQVCCGLPLLSNAEFEAARKNADVNLNSLVRYAKAGYKIVGASTSCTLSLKSDYRHILDIDTQEAELVSQNTYDICEFLLELADAGQLKTDFKPVTDFILPYHSPCQLKAHNMGLPAIELMELVPGVKIRHIQAECCGIAGTYGYKREKYQIGMDVGQPVFEQVKAVGSPVAVCDSETCRWQINHATGVTMIHPVELLAKAYGLTY